MEHGWRWYHSWFWSTVYHGMGSGCLVSKRYTYSNSSFQVDVSKSNAPLKMWLFLPNNLTTSIVCRGQPGMMQSHRSDVESAVRNKDSAVILYNCIVKKSGSSISLHLNEMGSDWVMDDETVLALDSMFILSEHSWDIRPFIYFVNGKHHMQTDFEDRTGKRSFTRWSYYWYIEILACWWEILVRTSICEMHLTNMCTTLHASQWFV